MELLIGTSNEKERNKRRSYGLYNQQPAEYEESDWIFLKIKKWG